LNTPSPDAGHLRFGVFELDLKTGELRRAGVRVKLQPQPFKALALLASRAQEMVSREELYAHIWGDTIVEEQNLNFCIKQIRDALGDDADSPRYIETLPKRGYRFLVAVEGLPKPGEPGPVPPAPDPRPRPWRAALLWIAVLAGAGLVLFLVRDRLPFWPGRPHPSERMMLLVLPFDNMSGDASQEYFSDGLTEEMITQLGRLNPDRLGVLARNTAMTYKDTKKSVTEIGKEVKVNYILEGSVRRAGNHVRISAQLIQVSDQNHLWAENYERGVEDVLAIQSEVARRIADSLAFELLPAGQAALERPAVNPDAYDAYFRGRYQWNKRTPEALRRSIEFYQEAVAADPNYALAYAGLADSYMLLASIPYDELPPHDAMPKAKAAAVRALALDDSLGQAHAALAYAKLVYDRDWHAADREFRRAIELNPGYATAHQWYAIYFWVTGQPDRALEEIQTAQALDPYSLVISLTRGWHYYYQRQYDLAIDDLSDTVRMEPAFFAGHFHLGMAYLQAGKPAEAVAELEQAVTLSGGSPLCRASLAYAYAVTGKKAEARRILDELAQLSKRRYVPALYPAAIYAGLGETDRALDWLEKASEERSDHFIFIGLEPTFDSLRAQPRFQALLRRVGSPS